MLYVPIVYTHCFENIFIKSIATGLTIALLEVFVITPLERLKVWFISRSKTTGHIQVLLQEKKLFSRIFLYRGFWVVCARQIVSWITFLSVHDGMMFFVKNILYIQKMTVGTVFLVSLSEAVVNTAFILPIDKIKSSLQKIHAHQKIKDEIFYTYKNFGIKGFYVGYYVRLIQYMINACGLIWVLEYFRLLIKV